jgi:DNA-binding SARP family transcriptional activator
MGLRIYTLGPFRVHHGDTPITDSAWKTQKNKTLLKILLTYRQRALTRDQLMEWLWPHLDPDAAGRNLRVAISQLRRALEPNLPRGSQSSFILTTDAGYAWNTQADHWLDVGEFEGLADSRWQIADGDHQPSAISDLPTAISHMQSAINLYRGDYLEEDRYADWAMAERERLRELYFTLLTRLAEAYARQGRYRRAVATCREVLASDRCREGIWCQLMLYHYHAGDQALALRAYEECRQALAEELDVEPLPATRALYEQVLRREIPTPRRDIPNNLPHELTSFVGREAELAEIAKRLESPACRLLTLVGPGGAGKTRLALRAASERMAQFPHGVYFVSLAPLNSADFMVAAIADALGIHFYGREDPKVQLLNRLREKKMLLVMDNFEHLLAGAGLVIEILQHAPEIKVLVTSREPLNFQAEWCVDIGGLPYPDLGFGISDLGLQRRKFAIHNPKSEIGAPCSCSWSGPARFGPASPSLRPQHPTCCAFAGSWRGCRWALSWPRPGCGSSPARRSRFKSNATWNFWPPPCGMCRSGTGACGPCSTGPGVSSRRRSERRCGSSRSFEVASGPRRRSRWPAPLRASSLL